VENDTPAVSDPEVSSRGGIAQITGTPLINRPEKGPEYNCSEGEDERRHHSKSAEDDCG
jgi:hypothetical protein